MCNEVPISQYNLTFFALDKCNYNVIYYITFILYYYIL